MTPGDAARDAARRAAATAVQADLAALPDPPVPVEYAARWAAALAAESAARASSGAGRLAVRPVRPARRRLRSAVAGLAAAALLVGLAALASSALTSSAAWPKPLAAEVDGAVGGIELAWAGLAAMGDTDAGALADPARRAGCLRSVVDGVDPTAVPLGGRQVVLNGRPGVLLVLPSGERGGFRVLIVDAGCGPHGGTLLADTTMGDGS